MTVVRKIADVKDLVRLAVDDPKAYFPAIEKLAASDDWAEREVGASVVMEIGKKKPEVVIAEMLIGPTIPTRTSVGVPAKGFAASHVKILTLSFPFSPGSTWTPTLT